MKQVGGTEKAAWPYFPLEQMNIWQCIHWDGNQSRSRLSGERQDQFGALLFDMGQANKTVVGSMGLQLREGNLVKIWTGILPERG